MAAAPVDALQPALVLLASGTVAAIASRYLKFSPIVGYLAIGVLIGPYCLGLMEDSDATHLLAELGVVFLLFDIGLHFSLSEIRESREDMLGLAPAQVGFTALGFTLLLVPFGVDWPVAIVLGISLALSSTAVVSRVLSERNLRSCPLGHSAMSVLVFQDIIAIFLLIFAGSLGNDASALPVILGLALGKSLLAFAAAVAAGRFLIRPLFQMLAETRNQEAFTAVALLLVLASAWATGLVGLSLTLGAFLAGVAMADTRYRHQVMMEVQPFRGLLLSMFFINVGLMLNVPGLFAALPLVILATAVIMVGKTALAIAAAKLNKWSTPGAIQLGFLIGQGSEFTLVIASLAAVIAIADSQVLSVLVAATALSLAIAPFWTGLGLRIARSVARKQAESRPTSDITEQAGGERPVLVYGMTPAARLTVDALISFEIPYIALDSDPERFVTALADGYDVSFGSAADIRLVELIGASNARATVIGQPRIEVSRELTPIVREKFPDMVRYVAVADASELDAFRTLGIRAHFVMDDTPAIDLVTDLLKQLDIPDDEIREWIEDQVDAERQLLRDGSDELAA